MSTYDLFLMYNKSYSLLSFQRLFNNACQINTCSNQRKEYFFFLRSKQ